MTGWRSKIKKKYGMDRGALAAVDVIAVLFVGLMESENSL